jgi:hypothetical protein
MMAAKVFISYRREDSAAYAGRIQDRLEREFERDLLFIDVDGIPLGLNFVKVLREEVAKCGVLLAVIGRDWLDVRDEDGTRRLDNPNDFVRIEIATALQREIPVIPILLDGTRVPKADQLPKDLKELALRNGLDVRYVSFHADMDKLIRGLKGHVGASRQPMPEPPPLSAITPWCEPSGPERPGNKTTDGSVAAARDAVNRTWLGMTILQSRLLTALVALLAAICIWYDDYFAPFYERHPILSLTLPAIIIGYLLFFSVGPQAWSRYRQAQRDSLALTPNPEAADPRHFRARAVRFLGRRRRELLQRGAFYAATALLAAMLLVAAGVIAWNRFSPYEIRSVFNIMEYDTNRPGGDYRSFDLVEPRLELCENACAKDAQCKAYTYVKPGIQGPHARCWLKSSVPNSLANSCCISRVKEGTGSTRSGFGPRVDNTTFSGATNIRFFGVNDIAECETACAADPQCRGYSLVKRGAYESNPNNAVCYLLSSLGQRVNNSCCISSQTTP